MKALPVNHFNGNNESKFFCNEDQNAQYPANYADIIRFSEIFDSNKSLHSLCGVVSSFSFHTLNKIDDVLAHLCQNYAKNRICPLK